jgi:2-hydroxy-3-keto-5-methylthiopentenyl-1-phosphate phosphatase
MNLRKKIFVNKELSDAETMFVKSVLKDIDLESYLKDSFIYVCVDENGILEISSVKDTYVKLVSEELNLSSKMAMQYLKHKVEIEQGLNKILYWCNINNIKKYVPVVRDNGVDVEYANFNVYAEGVPEAVKALSDMYYDDYMYLEDVDEEV